MPMAPPFFPIPSFPKRSLQASPTVSPPRTFSAIPSGYLKPDPCPYVLLPARSTMQHCWMSYIPSGNSNTRLYAYRHVMAPQGSAGAVLGPLAGLPLERLLRHVAWDVYGRDPHIAVDPLHDVADGLDLDAVQRTHCYVDDVPVAGATVPSREYRR